MKKNNQKGFMLVEAFIVSTFVIGILVFMFVQIRTITNGYNRSFSYNTIPGIYIANEIGKFVINNDYEDIKLEVDNASGDGYIIIGTDEYINPYSVLNDTWIEMVNNVNVKSVVITREDAAKLKATTDEQLSSKFKQYIKALKVDNISGLYRILVEFNDETYASIILPASVEEEV